LQFYRFLGAHSLLIGIFPFFIPVFLWSAGASLAQICIYIAITGLSFCASMRCWELLSARLRLSTLMLLTYWLELLTLLVVLLANTDSLAGFILLLGVATGVYNCFFWMTQRSLFLQLITVRNSGRQYGNFQIFVGVFLKGGIFIGGMLLEHLGFHWVFIVSLATVLAISAYLLLRPFDTDHGTCSPITFARLASFRDSHRSRTIFVADGLFLFLEVHFWTISLFLITRQDFARLGIIVIVMAVIFALAFFFAKNSIDRVNGKRVYLAAVALYALGWLLRALVDADLPTMWLFLLLLLITFFSSFFRLGFNKRFYDIALAGKARDYLVIKSYYTQLSVAVIFTGMAVLSTILQNDALALTYIYLFAALAAPAYMVYRQES